MADYRAIGKFLRSGQPTEPVPIALRDLPPVGISHAERIIARSRNERGRPRDAIEKRISRFLSEQKPSRGAGGIGKPAKRKRAWKGAEDVYR